MGMILMTNKEAADILKRFIPPVSRGDGKSGTKAVITTALAKAITVLENTPDEDEK